MELQDGVLVIPYYWLVGRNIAARKRLYNRNELYEWYIADSVHVLHFFLVAVQCLSK